MEALKVNHFTRSFWLTAGVCCFLATAGSLVVGRHQDALDSERGIHSVEALLETPPLFDDDEGGEADADDPAIWVHPVDSAASLIIGTKKNAGLSVYNLSGQELQSIKPP